ncbi:type II toxin-antitoxin system Phd/YefM family antitoxin [Kitasatospora sp. NPDC051170]|uniref:type II toxin-antitoxin system Phd/YefM family antitoxin n=1 Tax=Kitasatospora sp. NPDC051170 TaxID=3364056 RepID=UPI00379AD689
MDRTLSIHEARDRFAELVDRAVADDITVITREGEPIAALVPIEMLRAVEDALDELLAREARGHLGEPTVSLAEVLADLAERGSTAPR